MLPHKLNFNVEISALRDPRLLGTKVRTISQ